jgi:hypothetical protein
MVTNKCQIRKDLEDMCIPVGDTYVQQLDETQFFEYRWLNEGTDTEQFQVKVDGIFQDAQSIDFELVS